MKELQLSNKTSQSQVSKEFSFTRCEVDFWNSDRGFLIPGLKTVVGWENRMKYSSCVLFLSLLRHTHMYTYGHHERQYGAGHVLCQYNYLICLVLYLYKGSYTHKERKRFTIKAIMHCNMSPYWDRSLVLRNSNREGQFLLQLQSPPLNNQLSDQIKMLPQGQSSTSVFLPVLAEK